MKRVIYRKTGEVNRQTKSFGAILFRSRERNRNILIGNSPVEVSDGEYKKLKESKHGKDIQLFTKKTKLSKPMEIDISGPKVMKKKEVKKKEVKKKEVKKKEVKKKKVSKLKNKKSKR